MGKKKISFMMTAFRDGFQSAFGARVFTKDFLPAVEAARDAGINHYEAGGGARFQSLYFYCNEDAFDMMDSFRKAAGPNANLQTLARGINVVGLDSQPRDIIKMHAELFKKHGITTIRNFDALNDVNNLIYSGQCIVDAGLKHEISITLMALPPGVAGAHTAEFYFDVLKKILKAGVHFDSIVFKDASGTAPPQVVYDTIKLARSYVPEGTHLHFHTHETAGISIISYRAALDAGADGIDLSMAPVSGGTAQPDIITMWHALRGTDYDLGVDINKIIKAEDVFKDCMKDYFVPPEATRVEPIIPFSPMPGGALTANTQMMRDTGTLDQFGKIIDAMGEVIRLGGFGTSVTPVSQFYFQQAFNNVVFGPWKRIAPGYGKMVLGYFGKTPVEPDPEIVELARVQLKLEPTKKSPLDINDADPNKGAEVAKKMLKEAGLPVTDENIFITATCKEKGITFLKGEAKIGVRKKKKKGKAVYNVTVNGTTYRVQINDKKAVVNNEVYDIDIREAGEGEAVSASPAPGPAPRLAHAPVPGTSAQPVRTVQPAAPSAPAAQRASSAAKPAAARPTPVPAQPAARTAAQSADRSSAGTGGHTLVKAPLPGTIIRIVKKVGDTVKRGDSILVLEAMKMETDIPSTVDGVIEEISVKSGDQVATQQVLARIKV
ncbi:MAG: biotin attachment protein [Spirochaetes bacterium]|nr:MAG: biotin attachment protein [Spirochaetota bacterium]